MKRREFLGASCVAGAAAMGNVAIGADAPPAGAKEFLELRL